MSDLQCPATAVLVETGAADDAATDRRRIAARFELRADEDVAAFVGTTADEFRGEAFVVAAPAPSLVRALRLHRIRDDPPVAIDVDADGWRIAAP